MGGCATGIAFFKEEKHRDLYQLYYITTWYHLNDLRILTFFALLYLPAIAILFPFPFCCSSEENITVGLPIIRLGHSIIPWQLVAGRISRIHSTPFSNSSSNALHPLQILWPLKGARQTKHPKSTLFFQQINLQWASNQDKCFLYKVGSVSTEPGLWKPYSALQNSGPNFADPRMFSKSRCSQSQWLQ